MASKQEVADARANLAKFLQQASTLGDDVYKDIEEVIQSITDVELAAEIDTRNATDTAAVDVNNTQKDKDNEV